MMIIATMYLSPTKNKGEEREGLTGNNYRALMKADTSGLKNKKAFEKTESLKYSPQEVASFKIRRKEFDRLDYKYLGDMLEYLPFAFFQNLGYFGQPSFIYLFGQSKPSFLLDEIELNNPFTRFFNPFNIRSELLDSIIVIAPPRSFLFSNNNSNSAIRLLTYDKHSKKPYSKIRYFQGANDEGMIDAMFNIRPFVKTNVYLGINNSSVSPNYSNTDFSLWKTTLGLKYHFTRRLLLNFSYNYSYSRVQLFGGVSDSLSGSSNFLTLLFSPIEAPVNFNERYSKNRTHYFNLNFNWMPFNKLNFNFNFYYNSFSDEFRQNESGNLNVPKIVNNNNVITKGVKFRSKFQFKDITFLNINNIESNNYSLDVYRYFKTDLLVSSAVLVSKDLINNLIKFSLFAKYLHKRNKNHPGFGGDFLLKLSKNMNFYFGYSHLQEPDNIEGNLLPHLNAGGNKLTDIFFGRFKIKSKHLLLNIAYFQSGKTNVPRIVTDAKFKFADPLKNYYLFFGKETLSSFNISGLVEWKNFRFNLNFTYNMNQSLLTQPEIFTKEGIYYLDTLFNNNLQMQLGFIYSYSGKQAFRVIDFQLGKEIFFEGNSDSFSQMSAPFTIANKGELDFFFAGNIRKRATVYFTIKNLLNSNYYVVPYYPISGREFLFGIKWEFFN